MRDARRQFGSRGFVFPQMQIEKGRPGERSAGNREQRLPQRGSGFSRCERACAIASL
jgi:hypothetical protein